MELLPKLQLKPLKRFPGSNALTQMRKESEVQIEKLRETQRLEYLQLLAARLQKEQSQVQEIVPALTSASILPAPEPKKQFDPLNPSPLLVKQFSAWPPEEGDFDVLLSSVFLHGVRSSFVALELHFVHTPSTTSPRVSPSESAAAISSSSDQPSLLSWRVFVQQDFLPDTKPTHSLSFLEGTSAKYEFLYFSNLANAQAAFARLFQASQRDGVRQVRLVSATPGIGSPSRGETTAQGGSGGSSTADIQPFLDELFDESRRSVASVLQGTVTEEGLQTPLGVLSVSQVEKGEVCLVKALANLMRSDTTDELAEEYNSLIPHKEPVKLDTTEMVHAELETCQLMKDLTTVTETKGIVAGLSRTDMRLRALACELGSISPSHPEYKIAYDFAITCPSVVVSRIVKVCRATDANFRRDLSHQRLLCHGSAACNFVGILSRGLLLPTIAVSRYGQRRSDEGLLGAGVYFSDNLAASLKFCHPSQLQSNQGTRYVALCTVALGKCKSFAYADPSLTRPPEGFDSVRGEPGGVFKSAEYVVYDTDQIRIEYIVEFSLSMENNLQREAPRPPTPAFTAPKFETVTTNIAPLASLPTTKSSQSSAPPLSATSALPLPPVLGLVVDGAAVPLVATYVRGRLVDLVAEVVLLQKYHNESTNQVEAKYVFPLDPLCAVCGFEAFINGKHVIGEVKEKEEARQEYTAAVARGDGAYLMEEETADVFSVTIGNLPPNAEVLIKIIYVTELPVSGDATVFRVPGALVPKGQPLDVLLALDMPYDIVQLSSLFHDVKVRRTKAKATVVYEGVSLGQDFVLHVTTEFPHEPRMWVETNGTSTACMLVFYPRFAPPEKFPEPPELVVLLDCSQSMTECFPDAIAATESILTNLPVGECRFNLICFGSYEERVWPFSVECTPRHVQLALSHLRQCQPTMGGTVLWPVLRRLYALDDGRSFSRSIMVVSDARVAQPKAITALANSHSSRTRLFMIGVGGEVDEHATASVARSGGGRGAVLASPFTQHPIANGSAITQQIHRAFQPAVTAASVTWIGLNGDALEGEEDILQAPTCISSVFSGERCVVFGFANSCFSASLKGHESGKEWGGRVDCAQACVRTGTLVHRLAAKCVIRNYEEGTYDPEDRLADELARQERQALVLKLGLQYSLVTEFTSFVAVEDRSEESEATGPSLDELVTKETVDSLPYIQLEDLLCSDLSARKHASLPSPTQAAYPGLCQELPKVSDLEFCEEFSFKPSLGEVPTFSLPADLPLQALAALTCNDVQSVVSQQLECGKRSYESQVDVSLSKLQTNLDTTTTFPSSSFGGFPSSGSSFGASSFGNSSASTTPQISGFSSFGGGGGGGYGFGSAPASNSFGGGPAWASSFGPFGAPPGGGGFGFGSAPTSSSFGGSSSSGSSFGTSSFGPFGAPPAAPQNPGFSSNGGEGFGFGSAPTSNSFGSFSSGASSFGPFGAPPAAPQNLVFSSNGGGGSLGFGNAPASSFFGGSSSSGSSFGTSSFGTFGAPPAAPQNPGFSSNGGFGSAPASSSLGGFSSSGFSFGASSFGSSSASTNGPFGAPLAPPQNPGFSSNGLFGGGGGPSFPSNSNSFGTSGSSLFGNQATSTSSGGFASSTGTSFASTPAGTSCNGSFGHFGSGISDPKPFDFGGASSGSSNVSSFGGVGGVGGQADTGSSFSFGSSNPGGFGSGSSSFGGCPGTGASSCGNNGFSFGSSSASSGGGGFGGFGGSTSFGGGGSSSSVGSGGGGFGGLTSASAGSVNSSVASSETGASIGSFGGSGFGSGGSSGVNSGLSQFFDRLNSGDGHEAVVSSGSCGSRKRVDTSGSSPKGSATSSLGSISTAKTCNRVPRTMAGLGDRPTKHSAGSLGAMSGSFGVTKPQASIATSLASASAPPTASWPISTKEKALLPSAPAPVVKPTLVLPSLAPKPAMMPPAAGALTNGVTRATGTGKPSGGGIRSPERYITPSAPRNLTPRTTPVLTPFGIEAFRAFPPSIRWQQRCRTGQSVFELGFLGPRYFDSNCWLSAVVALTSTVPPLREAAMAQALGDPQAGLLKCSGHVLQRWIEGHNSLRGTRHTAVFRRELSDAMSILRNAFAEHAGFALCTDQSAVEAFMCLLVSFAECVSSERVGFVHYTPYSRALAQSVKKKGQPEFLVVFNPLCSPILDKERVVAGYELRSLLANVPSWYANGDQTTHCVCFAFGDADCERREFFKRETFVFDDLMESFGCQGGLVAPCSVEPLLKECASRVPILIYRRTH